MLSDRERAQFDEITAEILGRPRPRIGRWRVARWRVARWRVARWWVVLVAGLGSVAVLGALVALAAATAPGGRSLSWWVVVSSLAPRALVAVALGAYLGLVVRSVGRAAGEVRRAHVRDQR